MATIRSSPSAMPPCGGVPYSSASRKKPNRVLRLLVADVEQPEDPRLGLASWIRMLPPPISLPFSTRSYALASTRAGVGLEVRQILVHRRGERVVHRIPPAFLRVPLEEREVGHPDEREVAASGTRPCFFATPSRNWPSILDVASARPPPAAADPPGPHSRPRAQCRIPSSPMPSTPTPARRPRYGGRPDEPGRAERLAPARRARRPRAARTSPRRE
jgi:hypothetical protein